MQVLVWNMNKRTRAPEYLREHAQDVDVALLQETRDPRLWAADEWSSIVWRPYRGEAGSRRTLWGTAVIAGSLELEAYRPDHDFSWLEALGGSVTLARSSGSPVWFASVHAYASQIEPELLDQHVWDDVPISTPDGSLWETDVIPFQLHRLFAGETFIWGGDLNSAEVMDNRGFVGGNRKLRSIWREADSHDLRLRFFDEEQQTFIATGRQAYQLDQFSRIRTQSRGSRPGGSKRSRPPKAQPSATMPRSWSSLSEVLAPMARFIAIPESEPVALETAPRLASWMAMGHPDQVRLGAFLDHAEAAIAPKISRLQEPLALHLDIGLPPSTELLEHHDLDNYLYPLATRLGSRRFGSVWATKATAADSWISVDSVRTAEAPPGAPVYRVRTTRSAETPAWKQEIREQLAGAEELSPGPVELQLSFAVGPARNWANLWKPAIDSLGSLLGLSDPGKEWNPRDGRIVRLGLHREVASALGHEVEIAIVASSVRADTA